MVDFGARALALLRLLLAAALGLFDAALLLGPGWNRHFLDAAFGHGLPDLLYFLNHVGW